MSTKHYNNIFGSLLEQYKQDLVMSLTLTALSVITIAVLAVSSAAVWPLLINMLFSPIAKAIVPQLRAILLINISLLVIYGVIAFLLTLLRQPAALGKLAVINFTLGLAANMFYLFSQCEVIKAFLSLNFMMTPLWFIASFFLGCILSFMPALISACISKLIRAVLSIAS